MTHSDTIYAHALGVRIDPDTAATFWSDVHRNEVETLRLNCAVLRDAAAMAASERNRFRVQAELYRQQRNLTWFGLALALVIAIVGARH